MQTLAPEDARLGVEPNRPVADVRPIAILEQVGEGVTRLPIVFVNAYAVQDGAGWVLVDTGVPRSGAYIQQAAAELFGREAKPEAIVLTHGHIDHAGSALGLARHWDVPIYAHPLELPYLTGHSDYPPQDPTPGGAIAQMSRFLSSRALDFGERIRPLPEDGAVPGLPELRWLHTPGHAPGHVSLWREADRMLLAGDAFATMDMDSWVQMVVRGPELHRPPVPFTPDWGAALNSIRALAELRPVIAAAGHGKPITRPSLADELAGFAATFQPPSRGRYAAQPAVMDERGVVSLPPPVKDPVPLRAAGAAAAAAAALFLLRKRK